MNINLFKFAHTVVLHEKTTSLSQHLLVQSQKRKHQKFKVNNNDTKMKSMILDFVHCSGVFIIELGQENVVCDACDFFIFLNWNFPIQ